MKCLNCNGEHFEIQNVRLSSTVKGELLEVIIPCNVCNHCGAPYMNTTQMNALRRAACDVYRANNNLLTSKQIIKFREDLKMSQLGFANYLKVGEASIKRWESFYIQDHSQDNLMRLKSDILEAEQNYFFLMSNKENPNIYNGMKKFSVDMFDNVASYLLLNVPKAGSHLRLLHFYVDFLHFRNHKRSITGIKYVPLKDGPVPCLFSLFSKEEKSPDTPIHYDSKLFDDQEKETLFQICGTYKKLGFEKIKKLSVSERGFIETPGDEFISYDFAKDLLI